MVYLWFGAVIVMLVFAALSFAGVEPFAGIVEDIRVGVGRLVRWFGINYVDYVSVDFVSYAGVSCDRVGDKVFRCVYNYRGSRWILGSVRLRVNTSDVDVYIYTHTNRSEAVIDYRVSSCDYAVCFGESKGYNSIRFSVAPVMEYKGAPWEVINVTEIYGSVEVIVFIDGSFTGGVEATVYVDVRPRVY